MDFLEDLKSMPFHVIESVEFHEKSISVIMTFKSGNQLKATAPDKKVYEIIKHEMIENLGRDKVNIT